MKTKSTGLVPIVIGVAAVYGLGPILGLFAAGICLALLGYRD